VYKVVAGGGVWVLRERESERERLLFFFFFAEDDVLSVSYRPTVGQTKIYSQKQYTMRCNLYHVKGATNTHHQNTHHHAPNRLIAPTHEINRAREHEWESKRRERRACSRA
jgi:hypothetical protein